MLHLSLPANIGFSGFRWVSETHDEFDILVDDTVAHTVQVDCRSIQGSASEEVVYSQARSKGMRWLKEKGLLPLVV